MTKQISSYRQTIRSTSPKLPNHSYFFVAQNLVPLAWWKTYGCCLRSKNEKKKKLADSQAACRKTYLRASVCVSPWAEPHGRRGNEAQVQLIRGRRSIACNNKGRKCRTMMWNTKLQNKMKQIQFYRQLDGVLRCRSVKRGTFAFTPIWASLLIIVLTVIPWKTTSWFSREKELFSTAPFQLQCFLAQTQHQ